MRKLQKGVFWELEELKTKQANEPLVYNIVKVLKK